MSYRLKLVSVITAAILLILSGAVWPAPGRAQSSITLSELEIKLWPEYDKPGVLVIYSGRFAPDVRLPARLTFAIPAGIDSLGGTAGIDEQGTFRYRQPSMSQVGDQLLVSYDCPYPGFQFEYYYNPIAGQGADRQFEYVYVADYTVQNLTLRVQQPAGSSSFVAGPDMQAGEAEMGLPTVARSLGALPAGGTTSVTVSYRKDDLRLSSDQLGLPTPGTSPFEDVPQPAGDNTAIVVIAVLAAVLSLGVLGFTLWSRQRERKRRSARGVSRASSPQRKKGAPRSAPGNTTSVAPRSAPDRKKADAPRSARQDVTGYCHRCGRGLKSDERFCPACGTQRKGYGE